MRIYNPKKIFLTNKNTLLYLTFPHLFTIKFPKKIKEISKLNNGIQEPLFLKSKELNLSTSNFLPLSRNQPNLKAIFSFKTYTPKGSPVTDSSYFLNNFYNDFIDSYKSQKKLYNNNISKKSNFFFKKKGIIVGINNFNFIVNVNGIICNVKKKNHYTLYDTVDIVLSNYWGIKKKSKIKKFKPYWKKNSYYFKKSKVKNIYLNCCSLDEPKIKNYNYKTISKFTKNITNCLNKEQILIKSIKSLAQYKYLK